VSRLKDGQENHISSTKCFYPIEPITLKNPLLLPFAKGENLFFPQFAGLSAIMT